MEVHAAVGKRLWSYVRAAFFMARNGVLSNKRKLLLSVHLLASRRRSTTRLLSSHRGTTAYALRRRDYEFSCTNSAADPSSFSSSRRRLPYFPCLRAAAEEEEEEEEYGSLPRIDYYASAAASSPGLMPQGVGDLAPGEEYVYACASSSSSSPALLLLPGAASGEFSVRVSNYSSEDEAAGAGSAAVDADAEDFIRRFYDQLRRQNTLALLPCYMQQESIASSS